MFKSEDPMVGRARVWLAQSVRLSAWAALAALTAGSAVAVKELQHLITQPMAVVSLDGSATPVADQGASLDAQLDLAAPTQGTTLLASTSAPALPDLLTPDQPAATPAQNDGLIDAVTPSGQRVRIDPRWVELAKDPNVRWFNGRPVRPAKTMWMLVTAYSPDWRSCGDSADGLTATLHPVETNGHALVAADPRVLRYGSMITVPGYDDGRIVPVLDCGGAIKGRRLDVLFPTHHEARKWGVRRLQVTVWEYADGQPAENPRKLR